MIVFNRPKLHFIKLGDTKWGLLGDNVDYGDNVIHDHKVFAVDMEGGLACFSTIEF